MAKKCCLFFCVVLFFVFNCDVKNNPQSPAKTYFLSGHLYKAEGRNCMPVVIPPIDSLSLLPFPQPWEPCSGPKAVFPVPSDSGIHIYETATINSSTPYQVVGTDSSGYYCFQTTQKTITLAVDSSCKKCDYVLCDSATNLCLCYSRKIDFDSLGRDSVELNDTLPGLDYW